MTQSILKKLCVLSPLLALSMTLPTGAAHADTPLEPRAEVGIKGGSQRSLLTTEFWVPLAQQNNKVFYGDVRIMGDNDENREGNLGVGYRELNNYTKSVIGGHAWIDRRRTTRDSTFHQLTLGAESLGDVIDLRANTYVPLNQSRTVFLPGAAKASPYLAGTGIFYDTNGFANETPQYGVDAEAGYRVPLLEKQFDTIRVYGGGYHFFRNQTENVTGFRIRTEAVINPAFSVGARFQHDGPRGSQGFLEATVRFPFSAKRMYQEKGLSARLDESPERDVDIVTASKITPEQIKIPVINANTTVQQRVLYVDNSNASAGDGSLENPFNTMAAAQTALQANDVLYIARGNGTSSNMNQGLLIDKANVTVIGSGSDFFFDGGKFLAQKGPNFSGIVLRNAGLAPVITNSQAFVDDTAGYGTSNSGNGVMITADNAFITGITVSHANAGGIYALATGTGTHLNNLTISNVDVDTSQNGRGILVMIRDGATLEKLTVADSSVTGSVGASFGRGIEIRATNTASSIGDVLINNNTVSANAVTGIHILSNNTGLMNNLRVTNNTSSNNALHGIMVTGGTNAQLNNAVIDGNTTDGNTTYGIYANGNGGQLNNLTMSNNTVSNSGSYGLIGYSLSNGQLNNANIHHNLVTGNNDNGIYVLTVSGQLDDLNLHHNTVTDNVNNGIMAYAAGGHANNMTIANNYSYDNNGIGVQVSASTNGTMDHVNIVNNTFTDNAQSGLYLFNRDTSAVMDHIVVANNDLLYNGYAGVYIQRFFTTGTLNVDLGGGASNSVGGNIIANNIQDDIQLHYNGGGATVFAQNNWWGVATAPTRVILNGATLNATPFLTASPRTLP